MASIAQNQAPRHTGITLAAVQPSELEHTREPWLLTTNSTQDGGSPVILVGDMTTLLGRQPLYAGEWLERYYGSDGVAKCRRKAGTIVTPGTKASVYTGSLAGIGLSYAESPGEIGRQTSGLCSLYQRKPGAIFETTMVDVSGITFGCDLSVYLWDGVDGEWGYPRCVLGLTGGGGTVVARCVGIVDSNRSRGRIQFEMV